jgi:sulfur carrier protein ThiS
MIVSIEIIGALLRPNGKQKLEIEVEANTTVIALLEALGYRDVHIPHILVSANGNALHHDHRLQEHEQALTLSTLVGGG